MSARELALMIREQRTTAVSVVELFIGQVSQGMVRIGGVQTRGLRFGLGARVRTTVTGLGRCIVTGFLST